MSSSISTNAARRLPSLIYGTAWKKDRSRELVRQAIEAGFRAVDTAAQPKHYDEALCAAGIRDSLQSGLITREDLWIQSKFTSIHGQDPRRMPYDANASLAEQITTSIESSLNNFRFDNAEPYLDSLVLHSPFPDPAQTTEAWLAFSKYVPKHIRMLGISNVSLQELERLYDEVEIKPAIVQNRFHAETGYDARLRAFCRETDIVYQSFWTLTANPHLLQSVAVQSLSVKMGISAEVALYSLVALGLDVRVLNGTRNNTRMKEDLEGLERVRTWRQGHKNEWMTIVSTFKGSLSRGRIL